MSEASIRELFERAQALPEDARADMLDRHCPNIEKRALIERLLTAAAGLDDERLLTRNPTQWSRDIGETEPCREYVIGSSIGAFRIEALLGEGGSARVFRATRSVEGVVQTVALKVLRHSHAAAQVRQQFDRERHALVRLSHRNIAQFIDGGVSAQGEAYIALEFVDGVQLLQHARTQQLSFRDRLRLMIQVTQAVSAAHRSLIVHRDLKPGNVLVTAGGEVKLLDFGIAKLLEPEPESISDTQTQFRAFTPAYAAPEQREGGAITTATDVYALGVILGELLTGERLSDGNGTTPSARVTQTSESGVLPAPENLSRRWLRGDLDNILRKATASLPEQRYETAAAFADDLERLVAGQPVRAHPPSGWYRVCKFVMRHRGAASVTAALALALVASLGVTLWQARIAREEATRANSVRDFLVQVFDAARIALPEDQRPTPQSLAAAASRRLSAEPELDVRTRIDLQRTLAEVWLSLSAYDEAGRAIESAISAGRSQLDPSAMAALHVIRAEIAERSGRSDDAWADVDYALTHVAPDAPELRQRALTVKGAVQRARSQFDPAIASLTEALALAESTSGRDSEVALAAAFELGHGLALAQRWAESKARLAPALTTWRNANLPRDQRMIRAVSSLAIAQDALGESNDGEQSLREVLALKRTVYPADHVSIASTLRDLSYMVARRMNYVEAESLLTQAQAIFVARVGTDHVETARVADAHGLLMTNQRRFDEAVVQFREALAICERAALADEVCLRAQHNLGMTHYRQQHYAEARRELEIVLAARRRRFGAQHLNVAVTLGALSNVASAQNRTSDAIGLAEESVAMLDAIGMGSSRESTQMRSGLAQALYLADRNNEALLAIDHALSDWRKQMPTRHPRHIQMLVQKLQILQELGDQKALAAVLADIDAEPLAPAMLPESTHTIIAQTRASLADSMP
jgi:tetratricopeptide (TPR) repeat protein/tRNA A-37 threonylcarbamoyl transferase component Bud32